MQIKPLITLIASGFILSACVHVAKPGQTTPTNTQPTQTNTQTPTNDQPTQLSPTQTDGNQSVVNYALDLKNFSFSPALIEAEPGETITVKLTNSGGFHDFSLDELGVRAKTISQGEETLVQITVPADTPSGTEYEFYCPIGNHRSLGMVGTFKVK